MMGERSHTLSKEILEFEQHGQVVSDGTVIMDALEQHCLQLFGGTRTLSARRGLTALFVVYTRSAIVTAISSVVR